MDQFCSYYSTYYETCNWNPQYKTILIDEDYIKNIKWGIVCESYLFKYDYHVQSISNAFNDLKNKYKDKHCFILTKTNEYVNINSITKVSNLKLFASGTLPYTIRNKIPIYYTKYNYEKLIFDRRHSWGNLYDKTEIHYLRSDTDYNSMVKLKLTYQDIERFTNNEH